MKTKELIAMLKTAEQLGYHDIPIMLDESRDGETHYSKATATLVKTGTQMDPQILLVIGYSNA